MYIEPIRKHLILPLEKVSNTVFTQKYNPFYYHGALPNLFMWALFLSGLLLFAYYVPTLGKAYDSVKYITFELPYGNAIRSVHRYAADGMMIFIMIHMFRVWFTDRFREYRILPWMTGVIILTITFIVGLSGYLMIWDQDAVTLTYVTINLLKQLPVIGPGLANALLGGEIVSDYTLTQMLFVHLAVPVLLMFFLWMHYRRITRPVTDAPAALYLMLLGGVFLVAGLIPVGLGLAPQLDTISSQVEINWLYAWPHYLAVSLGWPPELVWVAILSVPVGLFVLPYLQKKLLRDQFAKVTKENCTGCSLCYNDCPYEAIEMVDRTDHARFKRLAVVNAERCANCGLCVGACAFKAIEIPRRETNTVLAEIEQALAMS